MRIKFKLDDYSDSNFELERNLYGFDEISIFENGNKLEEAPGGGEPYKFLDRHGILKKIFIEKKLFGFTPDLSIDDKRIPIENNFNVMDSFLGFFPPILGGLLGGAIGGGAGAICSYYIFKQLRENETRSLRVYLKIFLIYFVSLIVYVILASVFVFLINKFN